MRKSAQTVLREGAYYTISAVGGRVLEVADYNTENGAAIQLWNYEGQPWQQWTFEEAVEGQYRIKNRFTGKQREPIDKAYYICQTYNRLGCKVCSSHKIEARDLYDLVLKDIQELAAMAFKDADSFYERLSNRMERRYRTDTNETRKEIARLQSRNQEIDDMFLSLYTDKSKGILSEQRFMKLTATLEQEQETNQRQIQELSDLMRHSDEQESDIRTFIREIRQYAAIKELDETVLHRLIHKVLIGEVKKIDGQKVQEIRIVYNFVGEIPEIAA